MNCLYVLKGKSSIQDNWLVDQLRGETRVHHSASRDEGFWCCINETILLKDQADAFLHTRCSNASMRLQMFYLCNERKIDIDDRYDSWMIMNEYLSIEICLVWIVTWIHLETYVHLVDGVRSIQSSIHHVWRSIWNKFTRNFWNVKPLINQ